MNPPANIRIFVNSLSSQQSDNEKRRQGQTAKPNRKYFPVIGRYWEKVQVKGKGERMKLSFFQSRFGFSGYGGLFILS